MNCIKKRKRERKQNRNGHLTGHLIFVLFDLFFKIAVSQFGGIFVSLINIIFPGCILDTAVASALLKLLFLLTSLETQAAWVIFTDNCNLLEPQKPYSYLMKNIGGICIKFLIKIGSPLPPLLFNINNSSVN